MSIGLVFLMSMAAVAATLITLIRVAGVRRVVHHSLAIDIIFTVMISIVLAGTLTGLLIAIVACLIMTGALTIMKAAVGRLDAIRAAKARPFKRSVEDWCPGGTAQTL